ncbi:hypothetical protein BD410DRAFT_274089 [Rickenella mellea]|uniref:Uncharacterized protein n=1 Tax=Rickenella mellea TaxID=50990 RepID=A0A4Y7PFQ4_9AGAM|nr:hypothetical protein BD410DRAFT_274089 [Rickenella mellea]
MSAWFWTRIDRYPSLFDSHLYPDPGHPLLKTFGLTIFSGHYHGRNFVHSSKISSLAAVVRMKRTLSLVLFLHGSNWQWATHRTLLSWRSMKDIRWRVVILFCYDVVCSDFLSRYSLPTTFQFIYFPLPSRRYYDQNLLPDHPHRCVTIPATSSMPL